jgi:uncharacterized delta-60 repeat protein
VDRSLTIQSDGKILLGGDCRNGSNDQISASLVLNSNGTLDTSFGTGGKVIQHYRFSYMIGDILLQSNPMEKSYLVVSAITEAISDFCIARFNSNGSPDTFLLVLAVK